MVKYRHRHHAGSVHDLVKHLALVTLLRRLNERAAPWCFLDTHAGEGWYELAGSDTSEAEEGIGGLLARERAIRHPLLLAFAELLRAFAGPGNPPARYPGSPALAALLARPSDQLILVDTTVTPRLPFPTPVGGARIHVHRRDGFEALEGLLPPAEGRGLVLVDPPYEKRDESSRLADGLPRAVRRFPAGRFLAWYPLSRRVVPPRLRGGTEADEILRLEAVWDAHAAVRGTGLIIVRPSEECRGALLEACQELLTLLGRPAQITVRVEGGGTERRAHTPRHPGAR